MNIFFILHTYMKQTCVTFHSVLKMKKISTMAKTKNFFSSLHSSASPFRTTPFENFFFQKHRFLAFLCKHYNTSKLHLFLRIRILEHYAHFVIFLRVTEDKTWMMTSHSSSIIIPMWCDMFGLVVWLVMVYNLICKSAYRLENNIKTKKWMEVAKTLN